jgi:hypothetical protein
MTSESISPSYRGYRAAATRRQQSIVADLVFWTAVGAVVAGFSRSLGHWWGLSQSVLLAGGVAFVVIGAASLVGLSRIRLVPRGLVWGFGAFNLVLAPLVWVAAELRWLPLSVQGNWALVFAGVAALVLGIWQLSTLRRS